MDPESSPVVWRLWTRISFRFVFLYFLGDFLPIPNGLVSWVASRLFDAKLPLIVSGSGSGDKTHDWVSAFCVFCVALAGTVLWSILDRRRPNYSRLHPWLTLFLRLTLGATMLTYGFIKVVPLQMPFPTLTRLLQPYGEFSPMGVLWSSIGASPAYEMFTGAVEISAGILVVLPFTYRLGTLLCLAATTQIFMLNMTYDVPVKLFSFHLILRSLVLLAPDLPSLLQYLTAQANPLFVSPRKNTIASCVQIALLCFGIVWSSWTSHSRWKNFGGGAPKPELYGIWNVERMLVDEKVREPLLTDMVYAKRVVFDEYSMMALQRPDGTLSRYSAKVEAKNQTVTAKNSSGEATLRYTRPSNDSLVLEGVLDGRKLHIEAKLFDRNRFTLVNRGFHWVQEYPYNR